MSTIHLGLLDWSIIIGYLVLAMIIGIVFSRRAGKNIDEFFVAGRNLPWWIAGTSIVATTFAADTPLVIASWIRTNGIYQNWIWWSEMVGTLITVFFFAHLWRRSRVITDAEVVELRYGGKSASILRVFYALYFGLLCNCVVIGWVIVAMLKISSVMLGVESQDTLILGLAILAAGYTITSGFVGVVMTDLVQFVIALIGSFALAIIVLVNIGGPSGLEEGIKNMPAPEYLAVDQARPKTERDIEPDANDGKIWGALRGMIGLEVRDASKKKEEKAGEAGENTAEYLSFVSTKKKETLFGVNFGIMTFALLLLMKGWTAGQGSGYFAQRLFAAKNERHAMLSALWFAVAHYVIRPWPWILVGIASLFLVSNAQLIDPISGDLDPQLAYPVMMGLYLPAGLLGLTVASLLAAFMSTVDTQLNWGASYLVNDIYRRFIKKEGTEKHYVLISRLCVALLICLGVIAAYHTDSIAKVWMFFFGLTAGTGVVAMARWYWWRVNAWSEIAGMVAAFFVSTANLATPWLLHFGLISTGMQKDVEWFYSGDMFALRISVIIAVSTATWVLVTFLTSPVPMEHLEKFYRQVRPGGWWGCVSERCPDVNTAGTKASARFLGLGVALVTLMSALFGIGNLFLARYLHGGLLLCVTAVAGTILVTKFSRFEDDLTETEEGGNAQ